MVERDYNIQLDFMSPSIYQSHRHQSDTGTVKKNNSRKTGPDKTSWGNASPSTINGVRQGVMSSKLSSKMPPSTSVPEPNINLSRDELLKLLSVFEGELQARDEVIEILKSERHNNPALQERYGLSSMPLQALQRDAATLDATTKDHVAEQTKENLQKIIQHQKESYKKLKQALLAAEEVNQRLAAEVTEEKRKHQDYMLKSDDFVNLLEEERERLKIALDREKEASEHRERETGRKLKGNKDELSKLKSLSLVLVEERQQQVAELADHKQQIAELSRRLKEAETKCKESEAEINAEKDHAMQLENDLESQSNNFHQSQEDLKARLEEEERKNLQQEEKIQTLTQQLKKLRTVQKNLQKTDDQLWRIHEKLEKDEEHDMLLEEVELLRQRVKDMEEAEKIYTQAQEDCKDIRTKLEEELTLTRSLRSQLNTLQGQVKNQKDLQRTIEDTDFRFDELQMKFDFEKRKSNDMKEQLQKMKTKMIELDDFDKVMQESETKIKKQKEKIILLTGEKKCSDEQVKFLIDKNLQLKHEAKDEKEKVTEITEKLIQESKKVLKLRDELAQEKQKFLSQMNKIQDRLKEAENKNKEITSAKQSQAEEANDRLRRQVIMLKSRLDQLEQENEQKDKQLKEKYQPPVQVPQKPQDATDLVDMVKQLKSAEERCEHLAQQLHIKSKSCEELKRQLSQAKQINNNCNVKSISVESVFTQTENTDIKHKQSIKESGTQEGKKSDDVHVRKIQTGNKTLTSKFLSNTSPSPAKQGPTPVNAPVSKMSGKPPMSPNTTTRANFPATYQGVPVANSTILKPAVKLPTSQKVQQIGSSFSSSNTKNQASQRTISASMSGGKPPASLSTNTQASPLKNAALVSTTKPPLSPNIMKSKLNKAEANAPVTFRIAQKAPARGPQSQAVEMTFTQEVGPAGNPSTSIPATIKIVKDEKTASPVIKTNPDGGMHTVHSQSPDDSKRVNVTNQDSKIPKQRPPVKSVRNFQAQKDFAELQKKWNSKLNK